MLRRFFWGLVLAVAFALPALAQTCPKSLPIGSCSPKTLKIPLTASIPSGWTFTRTGNTATYWANGSLVGPVAANTPRFETDVNGVPLGYLNEPAATNIYLNSQAPATQTITVTAQAYTLSFYGTGTIALTGVYTGTLAGTGANNLVQLTFTPTAGALIATLTGTVTNVQVEAGSFATSRIITAGSTVTRGADSLSVPLSLYPWLQTATGWTVAAEYSLLFNGQSTSATLFDVGDGTGNNRTLWRLLSSSAVYVAYFVGGVAQGSPGFSVNAAGSVNSLAQSVTRTGVNATGNRLSPLFVANSGIPKMTKLGLGVSTLTGTTGLAGHFLSLTFRAGPSSTAWLQGGNY